MIGNLLSKGAKNPEGLTGENPDKLYTVSKLDSIVELDLESYSILSTISSEMTPEDIKPRCSLCGGKLALVSGNFDYDVDDEPFESGQEETVELDSYNARLTAMVCVDCGDVTNINYEGR